MSQELQQKVANAMLIIRMREGTVHGTNAVRVSFRMGIPYLAFRWLTAKNDGETIVPMRDVEGIYCAWSGTEDHKWRAVSQTFADGVVGA